MKSYSKYFESLDEKGLNSDVLFPLKEKEVKKSVSTIGTV